MGLVGKVLVGRWTIAVLNLFIIFVVVSSLTHVFPLLRSAEFLEPGTPAYDHAIEILLGMGVILISYGVALEERTALREIFGIRDAVDSDYETAMDQLCHYAGVGQLLLGLFSEIAVECVRIPNDVINTEDIEHIVLGFATALILLAMVFLTIMTGRLVLGILPGPSANSGAGH